jgi:hypothetical protein
MAERSADREPSLRKTGSPAWAGDPFLSPE